MEKWLEEIQDKPIELLIDIYADMLSYAKVNEYIHKIEIANDERLKAYKVKEIIWKRIK